MDTDSAETVQNPTFAMVLDVFAHLIFSFVLFFKQFLKQIQQKIETPSKVRIAAGKTVLVTTGRQTKTLHTVRALKEVGAKVIVTDYEEISLSAASVACDQFIQLPSINSLTPDEWISHFEKIIRENKVDMIIPVSTINEVLLLGLAKTRLQHQLPNCTFFCPDLETSILFDDRCQFAKLCLQNDIPAPDSGILTSRDPIEKLSSQFKDGIIVKRIESSMNRAEEIVHILSDQKVPECVRPSSNSSWQWQQYVTGNEKSVWYICANGKVTFSGCYHSEPDLLAFDPAPIPVELDYSLKVLISKMQLTGQFAFDFIECAQTGKPYVIECNPRSSSILETVSTTPFWGESFFNIDVSPRTVTSSTGFVFHHNCFPFNSRREGHFSFTDPLPFIVGQIAWPLQQIAKYAFTEQSYNHIDVNICKIVRPGPSSPRNIDNYLNLLVEEKLGYVIRNIPHIDTLLLDASFYRASEILAIAGKHNVSVKAFISRHQPQNFLENSELKVDELPQTKAEIDSWSAKHVSGETRLLLGRELCEELESSSIISWRLVSRLEGSLEKKCNLPLRQKRVLHLLGSVTSLYYRDLSQMYAKQAIENLEEITSDFSNVVACVHLDGTWSVTTEFDIDFLNIKAPRMSIGEALNEIIGLQIDFVLPHMFDYDGLTVFRSMIDVVGLPLVGSTGDALALSTHKGRTIAVARQAGVPVAPSEILHEGDYPTFEPPMIIKPTEEDNSMGVTLVRTREDIPKALKNGFQFGGELLCEKFIPLGKEIRVAVTENSDGDIHMLPVVEYVLSKEHPIRTPNDKLGSSTNGKMIQAPTKRIMNLKLSQKLETSLTEAATIAHKSLGCRDYSIYDFRVAPDDEPYMLESSLYCSFAPKSALVLMAESEGTSLLTLLTRMSDWAILRRRLTGEETSSTQMMGMKRK